MHQRMIPFLYPSLTIHKRISPLYALRHDPPLEKFQRTYFREDGTRDTVSILNFVHELRILPRPWEYLRCSIARYLADPESTPPPDTHTEVLEAISSAAKEIFSNVRAGKLSHFAYVLLSFDTNVSISVTNSFQQMDVRPLHARRSSRATGLYYH